MPMERERYPANWEQIATAKKEWRDWMRLIDASKFDLKGAEITWIEQRDCVITVHKEKIYKIPTVDAAPVMHGKWEYIPSDGKFRAILICSKCKKCVGEYDRYKFCPNCGAKMDLEE